jgi:hypothetical protein
MDIPLGKSALTWFGLLTGGILMAEIKSAIEIAMERTKSFHLSSEEKERLKGEELQAKAHGLINRFIEVDLHFHEVKKELDKYSPEQRSQLERIMFADMVGRLALDQNNERIFQGIEILAPEKKRPLLKLRTLIKEYAAQREKEQRKIGKALLMKFENMGIAGTAVLPKVEGSNEWAQALQAFRAPYEENLKNAKDELQK